MPTYSYRCDSCEHGFETVQRFADDPLTECPECGSRIRRVIQPVGVVFKGSGWYINDSRPKSASEGSESPSKPAATSEKTSKSETSETGTSSKTETAPPTQAKKDKIPAKVAD